MNRLLQDCFQWFVFTFNCNLSLPIQIIINPSHPKTMASIFFSEEIEVFRHVNVSSSTCPQDHSISFWSSWRSEALF